MMKRKIHLKSENGSAKKQPHIRPATEGPALWVGKGDHENFQVTAHYMCVCGVCVLSAAVNITINMNINMRINASLSASSCHNRKGCCTARARSKRAGSPFLVEDEAGLLLL